MKICKFCEKHCDFYCGTAASVFRLRMAIQVPQAPTLAGQTGQKTPSGTLPDTLKAIAANGLPTMGIALFDSKNRHLNPLRGLRRPRGAALAGGRRPIHPPDRGGCKDTPAPASSRHARDHLRHSQPHRPRRRRRCDVRAARPALHPPGRTCPSAGPG